MNMLNYYKGAVHMKRHFKILANTRTDDGSFEIQEMEQEFDELPPHTRDFSRE